MISDEEKQKIKAEIVEKINSVLEKNGESLWYNMACSHQIVVRNGDGR